MKKFLYLLGVLLFLKHALASCQDPSEIQSKCRDELSKISSKITDLNAEYEKIKADLRAGLFCSKCGRSKTELDKSEGFYIHLGNVKGQPVPATPEQMHSAHEKYMNEYNALKNEFDSRQKSCNDNYNSAVDNRNREIQNENNLRQQEALQQQQLFEEKQQEMLKHQKQQLLDQIEESKQNSLKMAKEAGERLRQSIQSANIGSDKIGFAESQDEDNKIEMNTGINDKNVDEFTDFDASNLDAWHEASVRYLEGKRYDDADRRTFELLNNEIRNPEQTGNFLDFVKNTSDWIQSTSIYKDASETGKELVVRLQERFYIDKETGQPDLERMADDNLDRAIDANTRGQEKRNLHFIKNTGNDLIEHTGDIINDATNSITGEGNSNRDYLNEDVKIIQRNSITLIPEGEKLMNYKERLDQYYENAKKMMTSTEFKQKLKTAGSLVIIGVLIL